MLQENTNITESFREANISKLAVLSSKNGEGTFRDEALQEDTQPLLCARLERAKPSYTVRNVPLTEIADRIICGQISPRAGDLVLARIDRLGQHKRIELPSGRRATLHVGDEVVLCYADRYAPDQFEARVPASLKACSMVAAGGIAAEVISSHSSRRKATSITPIGLLADIHGRRLNLSHFALQNATPVLPKPRILVVSGTSMNAGKTTTAAYLIKGLTAAGCRVGAAKLTGTGAGGDRWLMMDSGACQVLDFTDVGMASTFGVPCDKLIQSSITLINQLRLANIDTVVLEIADGLLQYETASLLRSPEMRSLVDGILFAAGDSMGALAGSHWLNDHNLPCLALSGALTASKLACQEAAAGTGLRVLGIAELADASIASFIEEACYKYNNLKVLSE